MIRLKLDIIEVSVPVLGIIFLSLKSMAVYLLKNIVSVPVLGIIFLSLKENGIELK